MKSAWTRKEENDERRKGGIGAGTRNRRRIEDNEGSRMGKEGRCRKSEKKVKKMSREDVRGKEEDGGRTREELWSIRDIERGEEN